MAGESYDPDLVGEAFLTQFGAPEAISQHAEIRGTLGRELYPKENAAGFDRSGGDSAVNAYASHVGDLFQQRMESLGHGADVERRRKDLEHQLKARAQHVLLHAMAKRMADEGYTGRGTASYIGERVPFVGMGQGIADAAELTNAAKAIEEGRGSYTHYRDLARYLAHEQTDNDRSIGGQAFDIASQIPAGAAEFAMSGGTATAERALASQGIKAFMRSLATRAGAGAAAKELGSRGLRTIALQAPTMPARVAAGMAGRMAPHPELTDEGLTFKEGQGVGEAALKSVGADVAERFVFGATGALDHSGAAEKLATAGKQTAMREWAGRVANLSLTSEAVADIQKLARTAPEGGPLWQLGAAYTSGDDEAKAKATQNLLAHAAAYGLFEGGMTGYHRARRGGLSDTGATRKSFDDIVKQVAEVEKMTPEARAALLRERGIEPVDLGMTAKTGPEVRLPSDPMMAAMEQTASMALRDAPEKAKESPKALLDHLYDNGVPDYFIKRALVEKFGVEAAGKAEEAWVMEQAQRPPRPKDEDVAPGERFNRPESSRETPMPTSTPPPAESPAPVKEPSAPEVEVERHGRPGDSASAFNIDIRNEARKELDAKLAEHGIKLTPAQHKTLAALADGEYQAQQAIAEGVSRQAINARIAEALKRFPEGEYKNNLKALAAKGMVADLPGSPSGKGGEAGTGVERGELTSQGANSTEPLRPDETSAIPGEAEIVKEIDRRRKELRRQGFTRDAIEKQLGEQMADIKASAKRAVKLAKEHERLESDERGRHVRSDETEAASAEIIQQAGRVGRARARRKAEAADQAPPGAGPEAAAPAPAERNRDKDRPVAPHQAIGEGVAAVDPFNISAEEAETILNIESAFSKLGELTDPKARGELLPATHNLLVDVVSSKNKYVIDMVKDLLKEDGLTTPEVNAAVARAQAEASPERNAPEQVQDRLSRAKTLLNKIVAAANMDNHTLDQKHHQLGLSNNEFLRHLEAVYRQMHDMPDFMRPPDRVNRSMDGIARELSNELLPALRKAGMNKEADFYQHFGLPLVEEARADLLGKPKPPDRGQGYKDWQPQGKGDSAKGKQWKAELRNELARHGAAELARNTPGEHANEGTSIGSGFDIANYSMPQAAAEKALTRQGHSINYARGQTSPNGAGGAGPGTVAQGVVDVNEAGEIGRGSLRHMGAKKAQARDEAAHSLATAEAHFQQHIEGQRADAGREQEFLKIQNALESGNPSQLSGVARVFYDTYKRIKAAYTAALTSRDIVDAAIQDHVTHLWEDPTNPNATPEEIAGRLMRARRPFAGRESFTKQRTFATYEEGVRAGLVPKSWNPATLAKLEFDQYAKSIASHDFIKEMKAGKLMVYRPLGADAPAGWTSPKEKNWQQFAPPVKEIKEYFDKRQSEALHKVAADLGVNVETVQSIPGAPGAAGSHVPGEILRKFGTPEEVLAHEIGHEIDHQHPQLRASLVNDPVTLKELESLADLRASGQVSPQFQQYLRSHPELLPNLVAAYIHAPELMKQTAPHAAAVFDAFIKADPKLKGLADVKPGLEIGEREQAIRLAGPMLTGNWYMPDTITKLVENHLSQGLANQPGLPGKAFRWWRGAGNMMTNMILGVSGFHAGTTAVNATGTAIEQALHEATRGEFLKAGKSLRGAVPLEAAVEGVVRGRAIEKAWLEPFGATPEMQQMAEWLKESGTRVRPEQESLGDHYDQFMRSYRMIRGGRIWEALPTALRTAFPALVQLTSKPVMSRMVPLVKAHALSEAIKFEMEQNPNLTLQERRAKLGKLADTMDDRFGQIVNDNLFLNRTVRDVLHSSFLSFGWNLGDVRGAVGGLKDLASPSMYKGLAKGEGLSRRTGFIIATMAGTAIYGSLYQFLRTGKLPEDTQDLWFPQNGETNKDGTKGRTSIPGYMKDAHALTNRAGEGPLQWKENAWQMLKGKEHPLIRYVGEFLENKDWRGKEIAKKSDSMPSQGKDVALHFLRQLVPISAQKILEAGKKGEPLDRQAENFFGLSPAPYTVTHTPEQQRLREKLKKK